MTHRGDTWDAELGGVRLLAEQCSTCVFRPGNLMHLAPGRLRELIAVNRAAGAYLVCHQTLNAGGKHHPATRGEALCRGFYDLCQRTRPTTFIQVGDRLEWWREVPPPPAEERGA